MSRRIAVIESPLDQRAGEIIAYSVDATPYGGTPSAIMCTLERQVAGAWASVALVGSGSAAGSLITTPAITVIGGAAYRLTVQFVAAGQTWRPFLIIYGID